MIGAGQAALATPDPDAGATDWEAVELGADPDATEATVVVRRPLGRGRPPGPEAVLGRYRLIRRLGAGGFGTVWLAWDERLEREVALKLLPRERIASGRFEREARVAARLNHPGIVVLYEAAVDDEGGYLVSELVRGPTLGRLLDDERLSDRDIVRVATAMCDALHYAHGQGVVHRDVKPSNILMPDAPVTSAEVAKLTDFGVARLVGGDSLTRTGDVIGTTAYMAPEQAEGREADGTADLYSLALVTYEALTGVNPVRLNGASARGGRRLGTYLPAVRRHRRDLPRELACAVDQALRPRPRERGTVAELREALAGAVELVDDASGVVEPSRRGLPARPSSDRRLIPRPAPTAARGGDTELFAELRQMPGGELGGSAGAAALLVAPPSPRPSALSRLLAGTAAAAATAWFASSVLSPSPVVPALAVLGAALAVAVFPRLGWLALAAIATGLLIEQHSVGGAVVLLVAVIPTVVLLVRHPTRWPLPAAVPALSVLGVAGVWPGLAGRASTAWQRLVLGAMGWLWLVVGAFLAGQAGYVRLAPATAPPRVWMPSLFDTAHQVLQQLVYSGVLAPALIWGGGALVLPWITARSARGREPGEWLVQGALLLSWAAAVALLTHAVLSSVAPGVRMPADEVILGVLGAALVGGLRWPPVPRASLRQARAPWRDSRSMETR